VALPALALALAPPQNVQFCPFRLFFGLSGISIASPLQWLKTPKYGLLLPAPGSCCTRSFFRACKTGQKENPIRDNDVPNGVLFVQLDRIVAIVALRKEKPYGVHPQTDKQLAQWIWWTIKRAACLCNCII
jgi:hypothetical protein